MSSLSRQCSERSVDELPVELWMEVFRNITNPRSLALIMPVNRHLCTIVEEQLYRTVSLTGLVHFWKFRLSLVSSPRRAPFVQDIRLLQLEDRAPFANILASFLTSLRNLRRLELTPHVGFRSRAGTPYCNALCAIQIPHLRSLRIQLFLHPRLFLNFLRNHADRLEELAVVYTKLFEDLLGIYLLATIKFPALRVLECDSLFLGGHERVPVPPRLAHLSRPLFRSWELPCLAERLGTQLVSLSLGHRMEGDEPLPDTPPSSQCSLLDVKAMFPRLRYLQAETYCDLTNVFLTDVVDWFSSGTFGGAGTRVHTHLDGARPQSHSRITIAWVFYPHKHDDVDDAWDQLVTEKATRVLTSFGGYVERVLHKHHERWTSIRLGTGTEAQGERRVIREEMGDMDRYWAQVCE